VEGHRQASAVCRLTVSILNLLRALVGMERRDVLTTAMSIPASLFLRIKGSAEVFQIRHFGERTVHPEQPAQWARIPLFHTGLVVSGVRPLLADPDQLVRGEAELAGFGNQIGLYCLRQAAIPRQDPQIVAVGADDQ